MQLTIPISLGQVLPLRFNLRKSKTTGKMKVVYYGLIVSLYLMICCRAEMVGGPVAVEDEDRKDIKVSKALIKEALKNQLQEEPEYITTIKLKNVDVNKQIVSGVVYNFTWNTVYRYKCKKGTTCAKKTSVTKPNCKASLWRKIGTNTPLKFAAGKEPKCS